MRKNKYIKINRLKRKVKYFIQNNKFYILWLVFTVFFVFSIIYAYHKFIDNKKNLVKEIYFDKKIADNINLLKLIKKTNDVLLWKNTVKNKIWNFEYEKNEIKFNFPFVKEVKIKIIDKDTLKINYSFKKPKLIFIWSWTLFAVYWKKDMIYPFNMNYITWLNLNIKEKIYLPSYIKTDNNLKNIFWKNKSDTIIKYIKKIKTMFPKSKLFYIVWWENIKVITSDNKTIYFSLNKDIKKQISQLSIFAKNKEKLFQQTKIIDVWNLEDGIYIVENKNKWK